MAMRMDLGQETSVVGWVQTKSWKIDLMIWKPKKKPF